MPQEPCHGLDYCLHSAAQLAFSQPGHDELLETRNPSSNVITRETPGTRHSIQPGTVRGVQPIVAVDNAPLRRDWHPEVTPLFNSPAILEGKIKP